MPNLHPPLTQMPGSASGHICQGKSEHDAMHFRVGEEKLLPPGRMLERAAKKLLSNETIIWTQEVPIHDSEDQNMLATTCPTLTRVSANM